MSARKVVTTLALTLALVSTSVAGLTSFTVVDSSNSSWVARGYSDYTVNEALGWTFSASRNFDNGVDINLSGPALPGTSVTNWSTRFAAPFGDALAPGLYEDFQRFPFQDNDRPGLSFSSTGRLDNQAAGDFEILEVTYGTGGEVLSFAADFIHYGETNPNNWAIVEVRYNAVPEPGMLTLLSGGALLLLRRRTVTG